ncbi:MAG: efflux RND transporter permease subunit, partial [Acidobacteriota bacterium]
FSLALIPVLAARLGKRDIPSEETPRGDRAGKRLWYRAPAWLLAKVRLGLGTGFSAVFLLARPLSRASRRLENTVSRTYPRLVASALAHRAAVLSVAAALFLVSLVAGGGIGIELIPNLAQGEYYFDIELPEGSPVEITDRVLTEVGEELDGIPGIGLFFTSAGTVSSTGGQSTGKGENRGRLHVVMADRDDRRAEEEAIARIRERVARYPGLRFQFDRPSYFSFKRPVELEVYGDHPVELQRAASSIAQAVDAIPGLTDIKSSAEPGNPELQIFFTRDRIAQMGLSVDKVSQTLRTKLRGQVATRLNEGERQIDIVVRAGEESRARTEDVPQLLLGSGEARPVALKAVARTAMATGPAEIRRVGQRRTVVISGNLDGRDLGSVTEDIETVLAGLDLPPLIATRFGGQHLEMENSFGSLYLAIGLAVFLVYFVMASKFESLMHPFIILFTIPLGLIGVICALLFSGKPVSVIVLIGVVMLAGIVVKNAIVLVDYINRLREQGMPKHQAIVEAGKTRLRPILMTTLTTILGLVPMALGLGEGAEIRTPMAITVIGGLAVSTLLTLIVIPTVYSVLDRKRFGADTA